MRERRIAGSEDLVAAELDAELGAQRVSNVDLREHTEPLGLERLGQLREHSFVVEDRRQPADHVVDDVEVGAKMHVPRESLVVDPQCRRGQMKIVARKEIRRRGRCDGPLSRRTPPGTGRLRLKLLPDKGQVVPLHLLWPVVPRRRTE